LAFSNKCRQRPLYWVSAPPVSTAQFTLRLPLPRQSILTLVGHVLDDLQGLPTISF
jgi:hypothetical protein